MTTSDHPRADHPRTERRDDDREPRGLGQRILNAVLGDSDDQRADRPVGPDARAADPAAPVAGGTNRGAEHRTGALTGSPESSAPTGARDAGYADPRGTTGVAGHDPSRTAGDARRDAGPAGFAGPRDATTDAGYDPAETAADARRDAGLGDRSDVGSGAGLGDRRDPRSDMGDARLHDRSDLGSDAGLGDRRDARSDVGDAGFGGQAGNGAKRGAGAVHDLPRTETAATGTAATGAGPDFVTPAYDPDRDRGYDPQAAGTAVGTDPASGPVARNTHTDLDRDTDRGAAATDYDPAQDTGYVDASRAEADRTTGRRDDDYDTGRVDTDRVTTEPVDRDRDHATSGAHTAAAAGAVAAAAFGSPDRDRSDRDRDNRFSDADDTATVDATDTGRGTPDTGAVAGGSGAGVADEDGASGGRERLVPAERADDYGSRWDALKGDFVDEPRRAVRQADELVGELLDELQRLFADQRHNLEQGFDHDRASTEDLRLALRRYRSFFDRLLSF